MTATTHSPTCTRPPSWTTEASRAIRGVVIARCTGCQAVELRTEPGRGPSQAPSSQADLSGGVTS